MATTTLTFDEEFNSLSLHRTWQTGDKWQLIAPDFTNGRGGTELGRKVARSGGSTR